MFRLGKGSTRIASMMAVMMLVLVMVAVAAIFYISVLTRFLEDRGGPSGAAARTFLYEKAHVIFGLPIAAFIAFMVVVLLRQSERDIKFEGPGFKVEGAAGQVVLWLVCFIVMSGMIKLMW
jgi:hypothetical protein